MCERVGFFLEGGLEGRCLIGLCLCVGTGVCVCVGLGMFALFIILHLPPYERACAIRLYSKRSSHNLFWLHNCILAERERVGKKKRDKACWRFSPAYRGVVIVITVGCETLLAL